jgi:SLT domain-containing protein
MAPKITITRATGTWVVRAGGAVLGESKNALELSEGDHPSVIYFPRSDIATAFLDASRHTRGRQLLLNRDQIQNDRKCRLELRSPTRRRFQNQRPPRLLPVR